ncbi:MAG: hypothetical protein HYR50_01680 [Candidatus Rokubacteria bacterium]|nr:hypothetical protein [Candidatus Rokubacteria bacterium]
MRRPACLVAAFLGVVVLALLATHEWDPRFFATRGPQWERHDPGFRKQADGTIFFEFAADPRAAAERFPRFRTTRIFYPLTARVLALGRAELVAWTLVLINFAAIVLGTEVVHRLLEGRGLPSWPALAYGGWGGLGLALLHDTSEPLAYLCVLLGIALQERGCTVSAGAAFLGALLTRETTVLFVAPYLLLGRRAGEAPPWRMAGAVFGAWGAWLAGVAILGVGSTAPDLPPVLPLAGYRATRALDLPATILYLVAPSMVAIALALPGLRRRPTDASLWAVVLNALLVLWLPLKTAELLWHSGRIATGLVGAILLATPLALSTPRVWRALAVLFASSASWTVAVTARYLLWDVRSW